MAMDEADPEFLSPLAYGPARQAGGNCARPAKREGRPWGHRQNKSVLGEYQHRRCLAATKFSETQAHDARRERSSLPETRHAAP